MNLGSNNVIKPFIFSSWLQPGNYSWKLLLSIYLLVLVIPPMLLLLFYSLGFLQYDILLLLGITGIISAFLLILPITLTISHLRYDRKVFINMLDSMPSMIIALDENLKVTQWNQSASEFTGISTDHALHKKLDSLLPDLVENISEMITDLYSHDPTENQCERVSSDYRGKKHLFDIMVYPLQHDKNKSVVIRIDDVTEQVHIEDVLVQSEKMLSLGGLAAGMAHEINNPLGAILQSCQNLQRRLFGDLPRNRELMQQLNLDTDSVAQYLEKQHIDTFVNGIASCGERAAEIIKDMLSFSRPGNGKGIAVDLLTSLEVALRLADSEFSHEKGADFRRIKINKVYDDNTLTVIARENQLEQVFLNMLLNAAQAIATHKTSVVPEIKIVLSQQGAMAKIEFCDNGPGIADADVHKIFEPFYSTKPDGEGTGLGLSISYFIVAEQLAGTLEVESKQGEGACFIILLPLYSAEQIPVTASTKKQINFPF